MRGSKAGISPRPFEAPAGKKSTTAKTKGHIATRPNPAQTSPRHTQPQKSTPPKRKTSKAIIKKKKIVHGAGGKLTCSIQDGLARRGFVSPRRCFGMW